jgi:hypothetical protein
LSWLLLALSCAVAALAAEEGWQVWQQRQAAEQQVATARSQLERARPLVPAVAAVRNPAQDDPARRLAYPWLAVFEAVEAASVPDVRWLGMEHAIDGPLRLEGEAKHIDAAWQAAEALRQRPQWRDVGLTRLEQVETAGGVQRFDLGARRADAATGSPR